MNPTLRNILAVIGGFVACMILNGTLLQLLMKAIPPPEGFDPAQPGTYRLLGPLNLLAPFLAHAVGSLVGGLIAALLAASGRVACALVIGGLHLLGGIAAAVMIPAPAWFIALDLAVAYLPMAWIGGRLALRLRGGAPA